MLTVKIRSNFRKVCMTIISLYVMLWQVVPNYASATMVAPDVTPMLLVYDIKNDNFDRIRGQIVDLNEESVSWELGAEQIIAVLKNDGKFIDRVEIPLDPFLFSWKYDRKPQMIKESAELKECIRKNSINFLGDSEMVTLEICTRLIGKVKNVWYNIEVNLCRIEIYSDYWKYM